MLDRGAVQIFQELTRVCLCVCQPDDSVYLSDESLLQEYVINEDGAIYMGTWDNIQCLPWNYGQVTITHKHLTPPCPPVECDTLITVSGKVEKGRLF